MLFEDKDEKILTMEEVNNLMFWELDERRIHSYRKNTIDERKFSRNNYSNLILGEQEHSPYYEVLDDDM